LAGLLTYFSIDTLPIDISRQWFCANPSEAYSCGYSCGISPHSLL